MNAERLHVVALALQKEFKEQEIVEHLQQIRDALERLVQNPQQQQFQQQLSQRVAEIEKRLSGAPSNSFSPAWRQIMEELGAASVMGKMLEQRLRGIFERNQITQATALAEIKQIHDGAARVKTALDQISSAFQALKIPFEELKAGECELGVLIPRDAVSNSLVPFANELGEISFIVTRFAELATGDTDGAEIRTISSTDLTVYLDIGLKVGAAIGQAVAWIIDRYKSILEIRKNHSELQRQGVPDQLLKGIEDHANNAMEAGMDEIVSRIVETYCKTADKERRHELSNGIRISLNKIANRIDRGFNFELRVEPLIRDERKGPPMASDQDVLNDIQSIQTISRTLEFMNVEHASILKLPESNFTDSSPSKESPKKKKARTSRAKATAEKE